MNSEQVKARQRLAWGLDVDAYVRHAGPELSPVAERLIELANPAWNATALDVGCGPGTATLPLARRVGPGGSVTGVDLTAPMVAWAERHAAKEGVTNVRFLVADAEDLGELPAAGFDVAVSNFAVIFAPDPVRMVAEVARVVKPGGVFALSAWKPDGAMDELRELTASISPPLPDGAANPQEWGDPGIATQRFAPWFDDIAITPAGAPCDYASVDLAWQRMRDGRPPFALAFGRLPMEQKVDVEARAREILRKYADADGHVRYTQDAILVRGVRRAG